MSAKFPLGPLKKLQDDVASAVYNNTVAGLHGRDVPLEGDKADTFGLDVGNVSFDSDMLDEVLKSPPRMATLKVTLWQWFCNVHNRQKFRQRTADGSNISQLVDRLPQQSAACQLLRRMLALELLIGGETLQSVLHPQEGKFPLLVVREPRVKKPTSV